MIEKFTEEELQIIKEELGMSKTAGNKKSICSKQFKRITELFPTDCEERQHGMYPQKEVWNALTLLCDMGCRNFRKNYYSTKFPHSIKDWARYSSVFNKERYQRMLDELLDVLEKYRKESEDKQ